MFRQTQQLNKKNLQQHSGRIKKNGRVLLTYDVYVACTQYVSKLNKHQTAEQSMDVGQYCRWCILKRHPYYTSEFLKIGEFYIDKLSHKPL